MIHLLPKGLAARSTLVMILAVGLVHIGSVALYEVGNSWAPVSKWTQAIAEQIVRTRQALEQSPAVDREAITHEMSGGSVLLHWTPERPAATCIAGSRDPYGFDAAVKDAMLRHGIAIPAGTLAGAEDKGDPATAGCLQMSDGSYLTFHVSSPAAATRGTHGTVLSTTTMVLGVVVLAGLLMRWVTAPLNQLVLAANIIGRTADPMPVEEVGPEETRNVARAFNAMQRRIQTLVSDRTQALAAVSHDLRTPITRLRLRAGFIDDPAVQKQIDADLDEMEAMIDTTLAYLSGSQETEPPRLTDISALLATLVDAAIDAGHPATYEGPGPVTAMVRPLTLKRALGNLIQNAVLYGGNVRVSLRRKSGGVAIAIEDDGPGIPEADLERVFEPFQRLEPSRNRSTGGVGLGLTIARQAILADGGALQLENRLGGGLTVHVAMHPS